jgi:hypothetical protein
MHIDTQVTGKELKESLITIIGQNTVAKIKSLSLKTGDSAVEEVKMKEVYEDQYLNLAKYDLTERLAYFIKFVMQRKFTLRNLKRVNKVFRKYNDNEEIQIDHLLKHLYSENKWTRIFNIIFFDRYIEKTDDLSSLISCLQENVRLKIQEIKCDSHHAYKNNYWNRILFLPLEEPTENGD